jgi:hypothetical protein
VTVRRKNAAGETMILFNFSENPSVFDRINPSRLVKIIDSSDEKWLGPGAAEDNFLGNIHGAFLKEWGFTPELIEAAMPVVLDRATARLGDRLSTGPLTL